MKKITFIGGGGTLGSTTAYTVGQKNIFDEIVLFDIFENLAVHHAMDIGQSLCKNSNVKVTGTSDPSKIKGSDVVYIASSFPMALGEDKYKVYPQFLDQLISTAELLKKYAPNAVVITLSNPVDVINTMLQRLSGKPENQFIGFSINDSVRLDMAVANRLGINPAEVSSFCVGEHGMTKVPVLSNLEVQGKAYSFTDEEAQEIQDYTKEWWMSFLKLGIKRTAGWSSGMFSAMYIDQMTGAYTKPLEASVILNGQYGIKGYCLGTPVKAGWNGVEEIVELPLNEREKALFDISAAAVKKDIDVLMDMLDKR